MERCEPHPGVAGGGWGVWAVFGVGSGVCGSLRSLLVLPGALGCLGSPTGQSAGQGRGWARALQALGQSWEALPESEQSSDVEQILQGLIQTFPRTETSSSHGLSTLGAGNYTCKAVIALLSN